MKVKKSYDWILISGVILIACIFFFLYQQQKQEQGVFVEVTRKGEQIKKLSLDQEGSYQIEGENQGYNEIVIQSGKVYIGHTNCPNQDCVRQGKINEVGEQIICLPHQVVIEITGERKESGVDGMAR